MKTELSNRTLWFDGTSQVSPELVPELLLAGLPPHEILVTEESEDVKQFNSLSDELIEFGKDNNRPFDMSYQIPEAYANIDLHNYVFNCLANNDARYAHRMEAELDEITKRNMTMLVRTLIYVIDRFKETNTFWGVGRGSSCASLVLFLIGLHKVDPIKYNIPMTEFFHD